MGSRPSVKVVDEAMRMKGDLEHYQRERSTGLAGVSSRYRDTKLKRGGAWEAFSAVTLSSRRLAYSARPSQLPKKLPLFSSKISHPFTNTSSLALSVTVLGSGSDGALPSFSFLLSTFRQLLRSTFHRLHTPRPTSMSTLEGAPIAKGVTQDFWIKDGRSEC